jgi:hypothetical protein
MGKSFYIMVSAFVIAFSFAGCENPAGSGEGQVYVGFAKAGSRTVVPDDTELKTLTIKVTFTGPGGTIEKTFDRQGGTVNLAAGSWRLTAKAYSAGRLRAMAEETVQVKSGRIHDISMTACIGIRSEADLAAALSVGGLPGIGHDIASGDLMVLENDITTGPITAAPGNYTLTGSGTINQQSGSSGNFLTVNSGVTLTLDGPTLHGSTTNGSVVRVEDGGTFALKNGIIRGGTGDGSSGGGGVMVYGTFFMSGGIITGNTASQGSGVMNRDGGTFYMSGGEISENTSPPSLGAVITMGDFFMSGGTITRNRGGSSDTSCSGVFVLDGTFTMSGGTITNNTSDSDSSAAGGVGVYIRGGRFICDLPAAQSSVSGNTRAGGEAANVYNVAGIGGEIIINGVPGTTGW